MYLLEPIVVLELPAALLVEPKVNTSNGNQRKRSKAMEERRLAECMNNLPYCGGSRTVYSQ